MFGYLRFILSIFVMLSHLGVRFYGLNIGVVAVVIFYILAGYVVANLYLNIFQKKSKIYNPKFSFTSYKFFLLNRINRIFPLYIFIALLTTIFLLVSGYGNPHFTLFNIFTNTTIIPLNFYMWIDNSILTEPKWWLIPPAWSLGTELQAYILLPLAISFIWFRYISIFLSILIYILANLNFIHSDYYGYRLIVGVFFMFMIGVSIRNFRLSSYTKFDIYFVFFVWFGVLIFLLYVLLYNIRGAYIIETATGILIGTPLVYLLSKIKFKIVYDKIFGLLSYAIFLSHFLSIWIFDYLGLADFAKQYFVIFLTLIVSFLVYYRK